MNSVDEVKRGQFFSSKTVIQLTLIILAFGLIVGVITALIEVFIRPAEIPAVQEILKYPFWALLAYLLYGSVAALFVPIPTIPIDLMMLTIFDPWLAIFVRLLANIAGGSLAFYLSWRYGRPLLKRLLSAENYDFVNKIAENLTWKEFAIIVMIPIINVEIMAYAAGIGRIKYRVAMALSTLAQFYRLVFVFFMIDFFR